MGLFDELLQSQDFFMTSNQDTHVYDEKWLGAGGHKPLFLTWLASILFKTHYFVIC